MTNIVVQDILTQFFPDKSISEVVSLKDENKVSKVNFDDGDSYVVKIQETDGEKFSATHKERIANEIAMAKFLTRNRPEITSVLASYDVNRGMLAFENLGRTTTVMELIDAPGEDGIYHLSRTYQTFAKLHATGIKQKANFKKIQLELDAKSPLSDSTIDLRKRDELQIYCELIGLDQATIAKIVQDISEIETILLDDETYQTVIHADSGPHNVVLVDGSYYLIDLEFGSIGCFSQDITGHRLGFPQTWLGKRVPKLYWKEIETSYFEEFSNYIEITRGTYDQYLDYSTLHWAFGRCLSLWNFLKKVFLFDEPIEISEDMQRKYSLKTYTIIDGILNCDIAPHFVTFFKAVKEKLKGVLEYVEEGNIASLE